MAFCRREITKKRSNNEGTTWNWEKMRVEPLRFLGLNLLLRTLQDLRSRSGDTRRSAKAWLYGCSEDLEFWCEVARVEPAYYLREAGRRMR